MSIISRKNIKLDTVAFLTLGCKVNSYETEAMQKLFLADGYQIVEFTEHADVYVINTCTVTNMADRKSRQMLHKARKMNENAIVVAVGCYVQAAKDELEQDNTIDIVIGNNKKNEIINILNEYIDGTSSQEAVIDINDEAYYEDLSIETVAEKTRAYIKIQDGCNQFCSYCIIPYARGRIRSRSADAIFEEVTKLVEKGYKEIVLTGIHLSSYGIDLEGHTNLDYLVKNPEQVSPLLNLIVKLSSIDGLERIRFGSLEPRIVSEKFVQTLSNITKVCPHFHLSLQSGCNETLKRMNRKYTTEEYFEKCKLIRKYFKNPAITTDIIVGFPGETKDEFSETFEFLKKVSFAKMHIFKYSVRKGTKAETMSDQVKEEVKAERSDILIHLEEQLAKDYQDSLIGNIENILIEETMLIDGHEYQIGHNERYLKLAIKADKDYSNCVIQAKVISHLNKDIMFCEIMD